jgi:hypothetical protein
MINEEGKFHLRQEPFEDIKEEKNEERFGSKSA